MPSTYSPNLRIELIANGEQSGTWGTTTNTNLGTLIEDAVSGYVSVSVTSANQALTANNGTADQSRNMVVNLTTTTSAAFNVYIPPAEKFYVIRNASAYDATIFCSTVLGNTTAAGTGVTVLAGTTTMLFSDGTNVSAALTAFSGNLVVSANSSSPALRVTQVGSGDAILVEDSANPDSTPFVVTSTGNVGIGTTSPTNLLSVAGNANITGNTTLGDASTDTVTVNGTMGVGGTNSFPAQYGAHIKNSALTGTNIYGAVSEVTGPATATVSINAFASAPTTSANAFTVGIVRGFQATDAIKGVGSTITNQHGVWVADQTQGTNNYGITSLVSSGTNKWNIYASGTAANYFAGNVGIGTSSPLALLNTYQVNGGGDANILFQNFSTTTSTAVALYLSPTNGTLTTGSIRSAFIKGINVGGGVTALTFGTNASGADPTEKMRIDSAGNVGIGTSSPLAGYNLSVGDGAIANSAAININGGTNSFRGSGIRFAKAGTATGFIGTASWLEGGTSDALAFSANSSATVAMRIDSSGNVGINTTTPLTKLTVADTNVTGNDANISAITTDTQATGVGAVLGLGGLYNASNATFFGAVRGGKENSTSGNYAGFLSFGTVANGGSITEKMRIDSSGNVGIGTSSTTRRFEVFGVSGSDCNVEFRTNKVNGQAQLLFTNDARTWVTRISSTDTFEIVDSTAAATRMTIDSSGNVGIGTSSPVSKLTVLGAGTINAPETNTTGGSIQTASYGITTRTGNLELGATDALAANIGGSLTFSARYQGNSATWVTGKIGGYRETATSGVASSYLAFATSTSAGDLTERARIDSSGNFGLGITPRNGDGILQLPTTGTIAYGNGNSTLNAWITTGSYNFTGGSALTIATQPAWPIIFGTNNTERARIDSSGNLLVGTTTSSGNGNLIAAGVYNNTTASGANVQVDNTGPGLLRRSTSSIQYKTQVESISPELINNALKFRPVWYRSLCDGDRKDWSWYGLIAEEVAELDPRLVHWRQYETSVDAEGNTVQTKLDKPVAEGVMYDRIVVLALGKLQEQQIMIEELKAKVAALEEK
jgi:hypothetical protein